MISRFDQGEFIKKHVIERHVSMFRSDISNFKDSLSRKIRGRNVLVIGGAGTIGSSFIKQLLKYKPGALTVVDYSENGLTELTRDLRSSIGLEVPAKYITYPFDFGSPIFYKLLGKEQFDIVACFAAHKHVRSEKDSLAIEAMVTNNVFNTYELLRRLEKSPPKHFFSVSTDKAANPVNVMGASKKLMEKVLMTFSTTMSITTARFANVAFSNGSLLYGFRHRIDKGQPLSAPLDVKRYFVSPEESGEICLLACMLGNSSDIFFPKLREASMKTFSEIADNYLDTLGLSPSYCNSEEDAKMVASTKQGTVYPVYYASSNTSGEKMYEEFYSSSDVIDGNSFLSLGVIKNSTIPSRREVEAMIAKLKEIFEDDDIEKATIVNVLSEMIDDFRHIEKHQGLDSKM